MTHYYFSKEGGLRKIDKMPPEGAKMQLPELREFIHNLLQQPPIRCERFTQEGVYPEDRIEWKMCDCDKFSGGFTHCGKLGEAGSRWIPKCRVAVLKNIKPDDAEDYLQQLLLRFKRLMQDGQIDWTPNLEAQIRNYAKLLHKQPAPSVDSPEPTAGENRDFFNEAQEVKKAFIRQVNSQQWHNRLRTTSESLIIMFDQMVDRLQQPPVPKTDEDAAERYANRNRATLEGNDSEIRVNAFLAGCQHVRGQQGDAVALCDCELSEKCKAGIYKQSEREPCKKIIQLIAEEIKNTWSEVYNKRWSANPKEGTVGEIDYAPFVKNFMPRLYALFTSRPGNLQQGEDQQRKLWEEVAYCVLTNTKDGAKEQLMQSFYITPIKK